MAPTSLSPWPLADADSRLLKATSATLRGHLLASANCRMYLQPTHTTAVDPTGDPTTGLIFDKGYPRPVMPCMCRKAAAAHTKCFQQQ
jgi:hypothetical protein